MPYWDEKYAEETWGIKLWKFIAELFPRILQFIIYQIYGVIRFIIDTLRGIRT